MRWERHPSNIQMLLGTGRSFHGFSIGKSVVGRGGPVLGGWLIDLGSWRAIFLLNLPLATAAVLLAWRYAPRDAEGSDQSLDWVGALLFTVGLGLLTWALTVGSGQGGWSAGAVTAASISFGLLVVLAQN